MSSNGNTVATGAPNNDGTTGNTGDDRGVVRVYDWNGTSWIQRGSSIYGVNSTNYLRTVSLSSDGNILAVGAPFNDGLTGSVSDNRGEVRILVWNGSSWVLRGASIYGEVANQQAGWSAKLSGNGMQVCIGLNGAKNVLNQTVGGAEMYEWS